MLHLSVDSGSRRSPRFSSGKKHPLQLDHNSMKKSTLKGKQSLTNKLLDRDDDSSNEQSCSEEKSQEKKQSSDYDTTVVGEEEAIAAVGSDEDCPR